MATEKASDVWVPVCCSRVMRFNKFRQADGGDLGALVCTVCNKNITLEQEPLATTSSYGEGAAILSLLGSPKPPRTERRSAASDDDRTL